MARVKTGFVARRRHKRVLNEASGYRGGRRRLIKTAKEAVMKAKQYAFRDRKQRKREFRRLWNIRINAATREYDLSYSKFIHGLKSSGIDINRKVLAQLAIEEPETFSRLVEISKSNLVTN